MTVRVPRLPFSLDPLIAEAKRRARQRRALVAVAVLLVAGGAAAFVASSSPGVATGPRPIESAVVASVIGNPEQPGQLRLDGTRIYSPRFGIAVILRNGSRGPVTLERVRAVLRAHWSVGQIGARFKSWKQAKSCVQGFVIGCSTRPIAAERPSPMRVAPGDQVLAQLNFRFLTCSRREAQAALSAKEITVVYRLPDGTQIRQHAPFMLGNFEPGRFSHPRSPSNKFGRIATRPCHR
jgi:hypothetical protein